MVALVPQAIQQYTDGNGAPLAAGTVTFYVGSTTATLASIFADPGGTIPVPNPCTLDGGGRPFAGGSEVSIYGSGNFLQVVKDSSGALVWQGLTTDLQTSAGISAAMAPVVAAGTLAAAKTALGISTPAQTVIAAATNDLMRQQLGVSPAQLVLLVQPTGGSAWELYGPGGASINIAASTTSGLQEAINEVALAGQSATLLVLGGATTSGGTDYGVLNCASGVVFPPMRNWSVRMLGVHLVFGVGVTGTGLFLDSMESTSVEIQGEVSYQGTGAAVQLAPTGALPISGNTSITSSHLRFGAIRCPGGAPSAALQIVPAGFRIQGLTLEADEINGGPIAPGTANAAVGLLISNPTSASQGVSGNAFRIGNILNCASVGLRIGTSNSFAAQISGNCWTIGSILPNAAATALLLWGQGDTWDIGAISESPGQVQPTIGVSLQVGATGHSITCGSCLAATKLQELNAVGANWIEGAGLRGTSSYGATQGTIYEPDGSILQYVNNAAVGAGAWPVAFPNAVLFGTAVLTSGSAGFSCAFTTGGFTTAVSGGAPTFHVSARGW